MGFASKWQRESQRAAEAIGNAWREASGGAWSGAEAAKLRWLVQRDGPGQWEQKAVELGTGRTSIALQSRWQVEKGTKQPKDSRRHNGHNPQQKAKEAHAPGFQPSPVFRSGGDRSSGGPETTSWSGAEITKLAELVRRDGPGRWTEKAAELGTGRTSAALMNKWYAANRPTRVPNRGPTLVESLAVGPPRKGQAEGAAGGGCGGEGFE